MKQESSSGKYFETRRQRGERNVRIKRKETPRKKQLVIEKRKKRENG